MREKLGGCVYLFLVGGFFVLLGGWFALGELGAGLPGLEQMWPVFPLFGSVCFLVGFVLGPRNYGLVLPGVMFGLVALFFFPFSLGWWSWDLMVKLWPVFPMILGLAFVAMWAAAGLRYTGLLVPAFLGIGTGVVGLAMTLTPLQNVVAAIGWPVAFLALGATLLLLPIVLLVGALVRRIAA